MYGTIIKILVFFFILIRFGYAQWSEELKVFEGLNVSVNNIDICNSNVHIVLNELENDSGKDILYKTYIDEKWEFIGNISNTDTFSSNASIICRPDESVHIFWGERIGPFHPRPIKPATDVIYVNNLNGEFSDPVSIFRVKNPDEDYIPFPPATPLIDNKGNIHIFFTVTDDTGAWIHYMKKDNNGWSEPVKIKQGGYPRSILTNSDEIILAYLFGHPSDDVTHDINSVLTQRYDLKTEEWDDVILVHQSGQKPASEPLLLKDETDRIHIVWLRDLTGDILANSVYHSYSDDLKEWTEPHIVYKGDEDVLANITGAIDIDGSVHTAYISYSEFPGADPELYYSTYHENSWQERELIHEYSSKAPFLYYDYNDFINLLYYNAQNENWYYIKKDIATSVELRKKPVINDEYRLFPNYPNPFNKETIISFTIPEKSFVTLTIYNVVGEKIVTLLSEYKNEGYYEMTFYAGNLASGTYYYHLETNNYERTKSMMFLK